MRVALLGTELRAEEGRWPDAAAALRRLLAPMLPQAWATARLRARACTQRHVRHGTSPSVPQIDAIAAAATRDATEAAARAAADATAAATAPTTPPDEAASQRPAQAPQDTPERARAAGPTLTVQALDDPIAVADSIPRDVIKANPNVILLETETGGHLGWEAGPEAPFGAPWPDEVVMRFFEALLEEQEERAPTSAKEATEPVPAR